MEIATKKRIGILRGGAGKHYASSLKKGGEIISHITDNLGNKYQVFDIYVDKDHVWHFKGVPVNPSDLVSKVDLVWNTGHPSFSNILNSLSVSNIGSSSFAYTLEHSKDMLREQMAKVGVQMPRSIVLPVYQEDFDPRYAKGSGEASGLREKYAFKKAKEIHEKISPPWIIKSFTEDTNMGIHLAKTFPELVEAIEDGVNHQKSILVEEFITGKVASVHSVPNFRDEEVYIFPLGNSFGTFSTEEKERLVNAVKDFYKHFGINHYLKSDFVLNPKGRVYLLQIGSIPNLKPDSHFSEVCESVGTKMQHVVEHLLKKI